MWLGLYAANGLFIIILPQGCVNAVIDDVENNLQITADVAFAFGSLLVCYLLVDMYRFFLSS